MEKEFEELKGLYEKHMSMRYRTLKCPAQRPDSLLGINGSHYLLKVLERSTDILRGSIGACESKETLSFIILVRAHLETTACLCYFYKKLTDYYSKDLSARELDEEIGKLSGGSRIELYNDLELPQPRPIKIRNAIKATDALLIKDGCEIDMFNQMYAFLSEYCHPNFSGVSYKSKVNIEEGTVTFQHDEEIFEKLYKSILPRLLVTASIFDMFFEESFSLLHENETMPELIK